MKTALKDGSNTSTTGTKRTNASLNPQPASTTFSYSSSNAASYYDHKTHIKIFHGENSVILANTLSSCLHLMNFLKEKLYLSRDDVIDLMDFDGNIKEIPNTNMAEFAIHYVAPTSAYVVVRIEFDTSANEKRYQPLVVESKLSNNMTKALSILNSGKNLTAKDRAKLIKELRGKQQPTGGNNSTQQNQGEKFANNSPNLSTANAAPTQTNTKKTSKAIK